MAEVDEITDQVAHDIRNQYVIGYNPSDEALDGGFRRIEVKAKGRGLVVRTRTGYYANPKGQDLPNAPGSPALTPTSNPGQSSFQKN